jgi:holo-[acyl-carrier protein] synthase
MIFGIGTDVVQLERVRLVHEKFGERFVERLLLPAELDAFRRYKRPVRFLAMRFAAKEAIVKAMGTGFAMRDSRQRRRIECLGQAGDHLVRARPPHVRTARIGEGHVTLTDEAGLIVAVVV